MKWTLVAVLGIVVAGATAWGQGSAAGAGFGGGRTAGGFGGGGGGFGGTNGDALSNDNTRPETFIQTGRWVTKSAILTPGDRVEYKLTLEKGEVLLASSRSDAFDSALSIERNGAVLLKNDDRNEGDQSPFLNFRAPEKGEYTLKVLSYRSVSGGQFSVSFLQLSPAEATLGAQKLITLPANPNPDGNSVIRLTLEKGKCYDLAGFEPYVGLEPTFVLGPSGVASKDFERIPGNNLLIESRVSGDFLLGYYVQLNREQKSSYRVFPKLTQPAVGTTNLTLPPGECALVEISVTPNALIRSTVTGQGYMQYPSIGGQSEGYESTHRESNGQAPWSWYRTNVDSAADVVRVFRTAATFRLVFRSVSLQPSSITLTNTDQIPEWKPSVPIDQPLKIGDAPVFLYRSTAGELVRITAQAQAFLPRLEIFRLNGELANALTNRAQTTVTDDLYFPEAGAYLIRFSCVGNGGSGSFSLKRDPLLAEPYNLGKLATATIGGPSLALYSVNLEAGKRYEFIEEGPSTRVNVDLLDEGGQFLTCQTVGLSQVTIRYFVATRSGPHRLWLRGTPGKNRFVFRPSKEITIESPNLGP